MSPSRKSATNPDVRTLLTSMTTELATNVDLLVKLQTSIEAQKLTDKDLQEKVLVLANLESLAKMTLKNEQNFAVFANKFFAIRSSSANASNCELLSTRASEYSNEQVESHSSS